MKLENYEEFLDSLSDWVWEMGINGIHTYSNVAIESILGYTKEEIINKHVSVVWGKNYTKESVEIFNKELTDGIPWHGYRSFFKHKDGTAVILESTGTPLYDSSGKLVGYRGVDRDITETLRQEKALEEAKDTYKNENEFKLLLLDIMSHDILNPVNTIFGLSDLLMEEMPDNDKLKMLHNSSITLSDTVKKTISLAQITSNEKINMEKLDVAKLFQQTVEDFQRVLSQMNIEVIIKSSSNHQIFANPIIIEVFKNFIDNAIKYGSDQSTITLVSKKRDNQILCEVIDMNDTIPLANREKIFVRGIRNKNKSMGRGIGLSIAKRIAEAHGARVGVRPNKNHGNIFYIEIKQPEEYL